MNPIPWYLLPDNSTVGPSGQLIIGGCDTLELAAEFGTPVFVYDEDHLRDRCRQAVDAFGRHATYATKAFLCTAMAKLVHEEGMRLDVATGGELAVALAADIPPTDLVLHGNNKSRRELAEALDAGVGRIVVDSFEELDRIESLVTEGATPPKVLLRLTPGIKAETHEFITTGQDDSKFGFTVSSGIATQAVQRASASDSVELIGVHCHIGSQVFQVDNFAKALEVMGRFAEPLNLPELVIGGGLGVAYIEGEEAATISQWGTTLKKAAADVGITSELGIEPGRSITAAAAVTLYEAGTIKHLEGIRTYLAVDGGMSDNPRPVLYGSGYETFLARDIAAERTLTAKVVGKHCESGDVLVREGKLPASVKVGDIIGTPVTGAYGHSMGSNYNKVLRPPVVFCKDGNARLVVRRETYDDLLATDLG